MRMLQNAAECCWSQYQLVDTSWVVLQEGLDVGVSFRITTVEGKLTLECHIILTRQTHSAVSAHPFGRNAKELL